MSDLRITIAQDLSSIAEMFVKLRSEAVNRAGDPEFPGGAAMVMLGPGADIEAWGYVQMSAMLGRLRVDKKETARILKEDLEPPLSFLASWADIVREHRGQEPSRRRATIAHEVGYLRSSLDWMLAVNEDGEPWFIQVEDFATRLGQVRRAMEGVLHDGIRAQRINARCRACDVHPRLVREPGPMQDGSLDNYRCPNCDRDGGREWVARCWHWMVGEKGDPPEWVSVKVAAAATGRSPKTIYRWTELRSDGTAKVQKRREDGVVEVCWVEVRIAHDTAAHKPWQRAS